MISAAQGRVQGRSPAAVIDIGSNSVRLVVYEGVTRSPTVLFNEKILCGLGKGLVKTGKLNAKAVQSALRALRRFRALADQAGAVSLDVLATAAAREAENGSQFIKEAEAIVKEPIKVLSGREEAYYSALGIISGFHDPDGIAGDLGGGSLELVDVKGRKIGDGITLPLGGLRLQDMSNGDLGDAVSIAQKSLATAKLLSNGKGRAFYAVGGTWRNLAKLHMSAEHYPLHVMHNYEIDFAEAQRFLKRVAAGDVDNMRGIEDVSKNRRALLSYGAIALLETINLMRPSKIVFSALGVREGFLYSLLPESEQLQDPLISAADELATLRARSPTYARELAEWSGDSFAALGYKETEDEKRYRRAACLVADISWRAHPDYRGSQSLNMISNAAFIGIDHPGRAYIALANFFRHEGVANSVPDPDLAAIASPRLLEFSRVLAAIMRISYPFSASMAGVVPNLSWRNGPDGLDLVINKTKADLIGDVPEGRVQQLAKLTGKTIRLVVG
ncbi:exopolyphosphatase [Phyllobacterium sp. 21LDTY02-6]|uniref:exopolyphosphatase n=1 Tax=unclassified Phyllobacterium TaxID=2638441 RepID=UPI0020206535|nr:MULTISPECIES: exopolyphosphatase [unclassified Phyllobacterium]MCO4319694.1 exopolyphosphatase [Phyllobacterium sp. 21LDTY02-6]MCX8280435.1 exopolyphosphatase [Phyllobacterium sp. 0TCS1.6C]MCX8295116.1 exopolyphosphatase [Phyllobacterium sp. 0TCS1.6A]